MVKGKRCDLGLQRMKKLGYFNAQGLQKLFMNNTENSTHKRSDAVKRN